jgi:hypothetical protein
MTYSLSISYDISRPSRSLDSYRLSVEESDEPVRRIPQSGPVYNDLETYTGALATLGDVIDWLVSYLPKIAFTLIEETSAEGPRVLLSDSTARGRRTAEFSERVIFRTSSRGEFRAPDAISRAS